VAKGLSKSPEDAELLRAQEALAGLLQGQMEKAASLVESGDIGPAIELYSSVMDQFKGQDAGNEAKVLSKTVAKGPGAKAELAAWKLVKKGDDAQRAGDYHGAMKIYKSAVKSHPDAKCIGRASAFIERH
jgi:tetratricopeptide (TPR) repeat protein